MLQAVRNLDTGKVLYFYACTPYEAMNKLKYYLSCSDKSAEKCVINKTQSNLHLYLDFKGQRYSIRM